MTIGDFDRMPREELKEKLFTCCGSHAWVEKMIKVLPVEDLIDLFQCAEEKWYECSEAEWKEAFAHHPQIGKSVNIGDPSNQGWSDQEQAGVNVSDVSLNKELAESNRMYVEKFGFIFIINATGKSGPEILSVMNERLNNDPSEEIKIAAAEQVAITRNRLEKLLQQG